MGLDEIIGKIESDTEATVRRIMEQAKAQADGATNDAKAKAQARLSLAKSKAAADSKVIMTRESSRAATEASQMYQERLNDEVRKSIESIKASFQAYTKSDEYAKLLKKLASRAAGELGEDCTIYVKRDDDVKIKPAGFTISELPDGSSGGLRAVSKDGLKYVDYTLDALLSSINDAIAVEIMKLIK